MDYFIKLSVDDFLKIQTNMIKLNKITKDDINDEDVELFVSYEEIFRDIGEELYNNRIELTSFS